MQKRMGFFYGAQRCMRLGLVLLLTLSLGLIVLAEASYAEGAAKKVESGAHKQAVQLLKKADAIKAKGKAIDALPLYIKAVEADPSWLDACVANAKCYDELNNYENATHVWKKVVELAPQNLEYKRSLARSASGALNFELATEIWQEIANANMHDLEACSNLAIICFSNNDFANAAVWSGAALDLDPKDNRARLVKAKLQIREHDYSSAKVLLNEILQDIPENDPMVADVVATQDLASGGQKKYNGLIALLIAAPLAVALISFFIYRQMKRAAVPEEPVLDLENATVDSVCSFMLQFCSVKFDMPRGFCWSVGADGRRLSLQVSHLIGETSGVAQMTVNRKPLADWIAERGTAPFLYEAELDNANFQQSFSSLIKELAEININVGVPVVHKGQLMAFLLLGSSRSANAEKVHQRFSEYAETVQEVSEKAGLTLTRISQRNARVIDTKTGFWNRDYYEESLSSMYRGCRTANIPMSVFMMRMDQIPGKLETLEDDEATDLLYNVGQLLYRGVSGEMNVTMCYLDNGIFTLIAPERDAKEAEKMAKLLKNCFEKTDILGSDERTTGCVAYCVAPDDGEDPVMLRSLLSRTFRELVYADGNAIKRVEPVSDQPEEEEKPKEELVIRRNRREAEDSNKDKKSTYQPFGRAKITTNAEVSESQDNTNAGRIGINAINNSKIVSLGIAKVPELQTSKPKLQGGLSIGKLDTKGTKKSTARTLPTKHRLVDDTVEEKDKDKQPQAPAVVPEAAKDSNAEVKAPAPAATPSVSLKKDENSGAENNFNYKLDLEFDEDGIEVDTQCCSQEVFEELIGFELEQSQETKESCALVYIHLDNVEDLRSTGRDNYKKLRRELAMLLNTFMRDGDLDIPGLVGEDDFAVFMPGGDKKLASSFADRTSLTLHNLNAGEYTAVPSVAVVVSTDGSEGSAVSLIERARKLAHGDGIHYEEA